MVALALASAFALALVAPLAFLAFALPKVGPRTSVVPPKACFSGDLLRIRSLPATIGLHHCDIDEDKDPV